jgi:hypothetical protein
VRFTTRLPLHDCRQALRNATEPPHLARVVDGSWIRLLCTGRCAVVRPPDAPRNAFAPTFLLWFVEGAETTIVATVMPGVVVTLFVCALGLAVAVLGGVALIQGGWAIGLVLIGGGVLVGAAPLIVTDWGARWHGLQLFAAQVLRATPIS